MRYYLYYLLICQAIVIVIHSPLIYWLIFKMGLGGLVQLDAVHDYLVLVEFIYYTLAAFICLSGALNEESLLKYELKHNDNILPYRYFCLALGAMVIMPIVYGLYYLIDMGNSRLPSSVDDSEMNQYISVLLGLSWTQVAADILFLLVAQTVWYYLTYCFLMRQFAFFMMVPIRNYIWGITVHK